MIDPRRLARIRFEVFRHPDAREARRLISLDLRADGTEHADECLKTISVLVTHWNLTFLCAEFVRRAPVETQSGRWIAFSAALALIRADRSDSLATKEIARLENALTLENPSSVAYPMFRQTLETLKKPEVTI